MSSLTLSILKDLIQFKSVTPDSAGSLEYIVEYVTKLGGVVTWLNRNQTSNVLLSIGSGDRIFAFAGHVDVVPPGDNNDWLSGNPYELYESEGKLIGRGVADMKGAIAAFMAALTRFVENGRDKNNYRILLLLTSDEEGSAVDGTPVIVEYLLSEGIRLNYCLVGEPSCVDKIGDTIKVGRRGSLTGDLLIHGIQGHIAYPHLCVNPIHEFAAALSELVAIKWDAGNQYFPPTSLQFANLNSGLGVTNVIPGTLSTNFNFRYNNLHTVLDLQEKVSAVLDKYQLKYNLTWRHSAEPFLTPSGDLLSFCQKAISDICNIDTQFKTDGGTSDGRFLIKVSDEIVELGLLNASIHKVNESTSLEDLIRLSSIYEKILDEVF